jgi:hypothetical protein
LPHGHPALAWLHGERALSEEALADLGDAACCNHVLARVEDYPSID